MQISKPACTFAGPIRWAMDFDRVVKLQLKRGDRIRVLIKYQNQSSTGIFSTLTPTFIEWESNSKRLMTVLLAIQDIEKVDS